MSFLFVDRIFDLDDIMTRGVKYVTSSDEYLTRNKHNHIVLWPAIIGETLGQMCAWNVMRQLDFKYRPVAGMAGEVKLLGDAKLGDCIELVSEIVRVDTDTVHYHADAHVAGKTIFSMRDCFGPMLPMDTFIDETTIRHQYERVVRLGDFSTPAPFARDLQPDWDKPPACHGYDGILSWDEGVQVVAAKRISAQAPYFPDHFPHKPVFPLTLLLNANINLADRYIEETLGHPGLMGFNQVTLRKIKMTRFVQPGDELITTMKIKHCDNDRVECQFRSDLDGKRIAVCHVEYCHD